MKDLGALPTVAVNAAVSAPLRRPALAMAGCLAPSTRAPPDEIRTARGRRLVEALEHEDIRRPARLLAHAAVVRMIIRQERQAYPQRSAMALRARGGGCASSKPPGAAHDADGIRDAPGSPGVRQKQHAPPTDAPADARGDAALELAAVHVQARAPAQADAAAGAMRAAWSARGRATLPDDVCAALTPLDDRLAVALERGDIALVRVAWLLAQPSGFGLVRRQELAALEAGAGPSPLLAPAEAVALVRKGSRSVGVVSHGWLSAGSPDPGGARLAVLRRALVERSHIEALFFDFVRHPPPQLCAVASP
jgi:hypothetical protein